MKTTLRSLVLVAAATVCFSSFADARRGSPSANPAGGSGSGSVQRQTNPAQCPNAAPSQDRATRRQATRAGNPEIAPGNGQQGAGNRNANRNSGDTSGVTPEG